MKRNLFIIGTVLVVGLGIFLTGATSTFAADPASLVVVKRAGEFGKAQLVPIPATNKVDRGSVIVWMNMDTDNELKVIFEEGKSCRDVTKNLNLRKLGFLLDTRGCYSTSYLDFGATTSLQFMHPGEFEYKLVSEDGVEGMGKIVVQ